MKLEKISDNKLKVTLTNTDVSKWNIKFDHFAYNTPEVQKLFWSIMKQAESELNFFADGSQLFVEAISTRTDGFILMVTKLDESAKTPNAKTSSPSSSKGTGITAENRRLTPEISVKKECASDAVPIIFSFTDFDNAVDACKQIGHSFDGKSTLYKYSNKYYLVLEINTDVISKVPTNSLLEYGSDTYQPSLFHGRLSEHGELLIDSNAVETFCTYF